MLDLLYSRRSTRKFLDKKVNREDVKKIVTAALLSPSSKNNRPWEFIVIDDSSLMEKLASILIQLEAEKLGLGSCWVQIRRRPHNENETACDYIRKEFNIPSGLEILSVIGIGYKEKERRPLSEEDLQWDKIHSNKFIVNT
jgi:nitroreductase